jgi:hypothetical protein
LQWEIDGRRFRNIEDYQAALRDKALIDSITADIDLENPKDVEKLYLELKNGKYEFESIAGRQFDDNIYELYTSIRKKEQQEEEEKRLKKEKRKQNIENLKNLLKFSKKKPTSQRQNIRFEDFDRDMQTRILHEMRLKERRKRRIIIVSVLVCAISFGYLGMYYRAAAESARQFEELAAIKEADRLTAANEKDREVVVHLTGEQDIPDVLPEYETIDAHEYTDEICCHAACIRRSKRTKMWAFCSFTII